MSCSIASSGPESGPLQVSGQGQIASCQAEQLAPRGAARSLQLNQAAEQLRRLIERYTDVKANCFDGDEWGLRLGQLWCARMTHFFEIWKSQGSAATYKFTHQDAASYEEPAEIRDADWGSATRAVQKRAGMLKRMGPRVA